METLFLLCFVEGDARLMQETAGRGSNVIKGRIENMSGQFPKEAPLALGYRALRDHRMGIIKQNLEAAVVGNGHSRGNRHRGGGAGSNPLGEANLLLSHLSRS